MAAAFRRYFLGGAGADLIADPRAKEKILTLIPAARRGALDASGKKPLLLYFGTATYDSALSRGKQADGFVGLGCDVKMVCCTRGALEEMRVFDCLGIEALSQEASGSQGAGAPMEALGGASLEEDPAVRLDTEIHARGGAGSIQELIGELADVILVSGGNTLYACDKWKALGLEESLKAAEIRGAVLCGGSAGAICWFDAGHSDSADPATWLSVQDKRYEMSEEEGKTWAYLRVPALGFLPGLLVPHGDKTQSNGVARADDFDEMLMRLKSGERGVHIDHWAALVVCDAEYEVWALEGKEGSLLPDGDYSKERAGTPAVWLKELVEDTVERKLVPTQGPVEDLFVEGRVQVEDEAIAECRRKNPLV